MKLKFLLSIALFLSLKSNAQNEGDSIFNSDQVHEVYLTFNQVSYWDSLTAYFTTDQYLQCDLNIDGNLIPAVGVKFKGNSSYNNSSRKKSFKVDLNEFVSGQSVDGLKKFNLNNGFKDPSFLREKIACDFYNEHGLNAPRCSFAKVYLNGVYWGLYNFIEEADTKQFLNKHFNYHDGNMFKGDPNGDLRYISNQATSYYPKYELHTNETVNDWTDLLELISKINNSGSAFQDSLETIFNTTTFIDQWVALNLFVNLDSYLGSGHNYFIYHDTNLDKFEWIAWDLNESFGSFRMNLSAAAIKNLSLFFVPTPANSRPLINNMVVNSTYRQMIIDKACDWLQYEFSNSALDGKIDSIADVIRPFVYADTNKFYSNQNFETNLTSDVTVQGGAIIFGLKSFVLDRRNSLMSEIASMGCIVNTIQIDSDETSFEIYPNPVNTSFSFKTSEPGLNFVEIFNPLGKKVYENRFVSSVENIDVSFLTNGIYFVRVNELRQLKIVVNR